MLTSMRLNLGLCAVIAVPLLIAILALDVVSTESMRPPEVGEMAETVPSEACLDSEAEIDSCAAGRLNHPKAEFESIASTRAEVAENGAFKEQLSINEQLSSPERLVVWYRPSRFGNLGGFIDSAGDDLSSYQVEEKVALGVSISADEAPDLSHYPVDESKYPADANVVIFPDETVELHRLYESNKSGNHGLEFDPNSDENLELVYSTREQRDIGHTMPNFLFD